MFEVHKHYYVSEKNDFLCKSYNKHFRSAHKNLTVANKNIIQWNSILSSKQRLN